MKLKLLVIIVIVGGYTLLNMLTFRKLAQAIKLNETLQILQSRIDEIQTPIIDCSSEMMSLSFTPEFWTTKDPVIMQDYTCHDMPANSADICIGGKEYMPINLVVSFDPQGGGHHQVQSQIEALR